MFVKRKQYYINLLFSNVKRKVNMNKAKSMEQKQ